MKKIICGYLAVMILCLSMLAGCSGGQNNSDDTNTDGTESTVKHELTLINNNSSPYSIVYSSEAEASIVNVAYSLQSAFKEYTGIELNIEDDFLPRGETRKDASNKILLGETNYAESGEVLNNYRYRDYGVKIVNDKLVIAAYNAGDLQAAVDWFVRTVLKKFEQANAQLKVNTEYEYLSKGYNLNSVKIGDTELKEYRFVYHDPAHLEYIEALRKSLANSYGYALPIVLDSKTEPSEHEIIIGETSRSVNAGTNSLTWLCYEIAEHEGHLSIRTGGLASLGYVTKKFTSLLQRYEPKCYGIGKGEVVKGDLYDDPNDTQNRAEGSEIRIMDANILAQDYANDWTNSNGEFIHYENIDFRKEIMYANLDYYQPAVVGLQEMDTRVMRALKEHPDYGTKYELLTETDPLSTLGDRQYYTAILYRKDLVTLEPDSFHMQVYDTYDGKAGHRCRNMAWATFTVNSTGNRFVYFVTHWDVASRVPDAVTAQSAEAVAKVNQIVRETGLPIFCMADWNCNEESEQLMSFVSGTGLKNTKYTAEKLVNDVGSYHEYGKYDHSALSCDHIFVSESTRVVQFETVFYNQQVWASDHSWIIADLDLSNTK